MKVLTISGSLRAESVNRKLLAEALRVLEPASHEVADLNLPLYDGDLEDREGVPAVVTKLAEQIAMADAVLISTPEYNQGISGVLKNALDWVSRTEGNPWADKPVAIMSAAAGRAGGARAQYALRLALAPFRVRLAPGPEVMIAAAGSAFDEEGHLTNELSVKQLTSLMTALKAEAARAA